MKIRFLSPTYIRRSIQDLSLPPIGIIHAGTEMEVKDKLFTGQEIDGINTYFKDQHGWYFWSGRAVIMYKALPSPKRERTRNVPKEDGELIGGSWLLSAEESTEEIQPAKIDISVPSPEPKRKAKPRPPAETSPTILPPPSVVRFPPTTASPPTTSSSPPSAVTPPPIISDRPPSASPSATTHWQYETGMQPWGPPSDQVSSLLWERFDLSGKNIVIGFVDTTPWNPAHNSSQIRTQKSWVKRGNHHLINDTQDYPLYSLLLGGKQPGWEGLVPNAQLVLANIAGSENPQSPEQLLAALLWIQAQSADIVVVNGYWPEHQFQGDMLSRLQQLTKQFAQKNQLFFAPNGEGRGLRPVNNWPAAAPACFSIGGYQTNGRPAISNQQSNCLDLLGPIESESHSFTQYSPSSIAAVYTSGIGALLLELTRESDLNWTHQDWQILFQHRSRHGGVPKLNVPMLIQRITATANNW